MEKEQQVLPNRQEIKALIDSEQRAYSSLVDFRKEFIPSKDDVEPAPFHQEWSNILLNGKENFAIEAFRESAKTQIVIRANLLHALTYAVPHRSFLVIICATQTRAGQLLQSVSREFLANKDMNGMVAEIKDNSDHALQVYYTDRSVVRIEAYGKGASVRGLSWGAKRPDLVIIDDPQGEEDARSETITENDWNWFLSDIFFLGQNTRIFLIGNNLGERCIIEQVIKNAQYLNFTTRRIPILNEDNKSAWPSKYSLEYILKDKENWSKVGKTDIWYRERMCQCISPDSQKFKKE